MAENQVQIEVELVGQKEVGKGLENITKGAEGVGETFKSVGDVVGKTNKQLGEGLSSVSDALGETIGAVSGVKDAFVTLGQGGALSFTSLLGPISLVVTAVGAVYEAYRQLSGAAQEAEDRQEALASAAGDLQSKLEALAENGVVPATHELIKFEEAVLRSQLAKEQSQKMVERRIKLFEKLTEAETDATEAEKAYAKTKPGDFLRGFRSQALHAAELELSKVQDEFKAFLVELSKKNAEVGKLLAEASKMEKEFEERSQEALASKLKELVATEKDLKLKEAATRLALDETQLKEESIKIEAAAATAALGIEERTAEVLAKQVKDIKARIGLYDEEVLIAKQAEADLAALRQARADKEKAEAAARAAVIKAEAQKRAQVQQQRLVMQGQINLLDIQLTKDGEEQKLLLIAERFSTGIKLAKDDKQKREVIEKSYQLEIKKLNEERAAKEAEESAKRIERQKEEARAAMELRHESLAFDAEHLQNTLSLWESFKGNLWFSTEETDRQTVELETRYQKEYELAEGNLARQAELTRRYEIEQTEITRQQAQARGEILKGILDQYGQGLAEATVASLMFGESFNVVVAKALDGMAKQAAVRALMETAEGLGALALGSPTAGAHFAAAAKFGVAAALAGAVSAATGQSAIGGANKNTTTPTSPTGTPQTSTAPQRERAETSTIVYNVNFGGAVVYDTKRAAEMAMTQRLDRRRGEMRGAR